MIRTFVTRAVVALVVVLLSPLTAVAGTEDIVLVIHGGAGTIRKENIVPERETGYRETLERALRAGYDILREGGSSVDAVEAAVRIMEDSPLFNAGRGSVFTARGRNEMDASIMDGATLNAGAVASVTNIRNPISAARKVMTESRHVMLVGQGAMNFAREQGLAFEDSAYFFTKARWERLLEVQKREASESGALLYDASEKYGTAGALALDADGNLAAATSTGGLTNKRFGRVGDSPIIGAGCYANSRTCAVSGTGVGEYFMRLLIAYDVSAKMAYEGMKLTDAVHGVMDKLGELGGQGGLIALDKDGNVMMSFNTVGMIRGYVRGDGKPHTYLFKSEATELQ